MFQDSGAVFVSIDLLVYWRGDCISFNNFITRFKNVHVPKTNAQLQ